MEGGSPPPSPHPTPVQFHCILISEIIFPFPGQFMHVCHFPTGVVVPYALSQLSQLIPRHGHWGTCRRSLGPLCTFCVLSCGKFLVPTTTSQRTKCVFACFQILFCFHDGKPCALIQDGPLHEICTPDIAPPYVYFPDLPASSPIGVTPHPAYLQF